MPIVKKAPGIVTRELKLEVPVNELLEDYARFIESNADHVVNAVLKKVLWAIKTNIADSLNVVVHVERRPGRRYISEVLLVNSYDPDADLFDYGAMFLAKQDHP
jgi:hypothetical protein